MSDATTYDDTQNILSRLPMTRDAYPIVVGLIYWKITNGKARAYTIVRQVYAGRGTMTCYAIPGSHRAKPDGEGIPVRPDELWRSFDEAHRHELAAAGGVGEGGSGGGSESEGETT